MRPNFPPSADEDFRELWRQLAELRQIAGQSVRPNLAVPIVSATAADWPSTTAGTYTDLLLAAPTRQHTGVHAVGYASTPAGVTGGVRLTVGGVAVGSAVAIPANAVTAWTIGPAAWGGAMGDVLDLRIQAKVTGGSGAIAVIVTSMEGTAV